MNTHTKKHTRILLLLILITTIIPVTTATTQTFIIPTTLFSTTQPDLLIFLSPQYTHDNDIINAIHTYSNAIAKDINWNTQLILLSKKTNTYQTIDTIIETTYQTSPLKACLIIGEDTNTALAGDTDNMEKPSTTPWSTLDGTNAYQTSEHGIISQPMKNKICIALLYPTSTLTYEQKKTQLINTLTKFTTTRTHYLNNDITILESTELNTNSKQLYITIPIQNNYYEDPTTTEFQTTLIQTHSMFFIHGHSNPKTTILNPTNSIKFTDENLDMLNTVFFAADGCYVNGWYSNQHDNNQLDQSTNTHWYGSHILTSTTIQIMVLGLLSQQGFNEPVSFIENALPELLNGATLAESINGDTDLGSYIIYGDPTFHYTLTN